MQKEDVSQDDQNKMIKLSMRDKMTADRLLGEYYSDIESICKSVFPNRTGDDLCNKINSAVIEAVRELGFNGLKLMNGSVLLDGEAYDPEYHKTETTDILHHSWIDSNGAVVDFASDVFHSKDGEQIYIDEYNTYGNASQISSTYGDVNLKGEIKKFLMLKIK